MSLLLPDAKTPVRPSLTELATCDRPSTLTSAEEAVNLQSRIFYLRSYLLMRTIIGVTGILLPVVVIVGDHSLSADAPTVRGSLSGYYYTGMRDFFVGALSTIAIFLITYKIFERTLNNVLTVIAGLAAGAVAFFPTKRPGGLDVALTPWQAKIGEENVSVVHYSAAAVFILSLALMSFFFGLQEGRRTRQRAGRLSALSPSFWRWFHWFMALAILLAGAFAYSSWRGNMYPDYYLIVAETVAIVAFGLSWLAKGLELDVLLGPRSARRRAKREVAVQNP